MDPVLRSSVHLSDAIDNLDLGHSNWNSGPPPPLQPPPQQRDHYDNYGRNYYQGQGPPGPKYNVRIISRSFKSSPGWKVPL
jgi:hypothetical protein